MARLARYIAENGDARDAHLAGRERVRLASLYRFGAEEPAAEEIGAANVRLTAEEFIERWPTSPFLFEVQLWRAAAEPGLGALRALVRDAPRGAVSARARAELCVRDKPNRPALFRKFVDLYGTTPVGKELLRRTLWRARLEVDGLPEGIAFEPAMQQPRRGRLIVGVVVAGDEESEALARKHEGERLVLVVLGGEWKGVRAPIARDPRAAVELLGVPDAPMVLVFNDGKLSRD